MPISPKEGTVRPTGGSSAAPETHLEIKALVYTRSKWGPGANWVDQPYMRVRTLTDAGNQAWGECVIDHHYGVISRAADAHDTTRNHPRFGQRRSWVRVDWIYPDGVREVGRFFGEIEMLTDDEWEQHETLHCRDFRWSLSQMILDESFAMDVANTAQFFEWCPGFNAPMVPTDGRTTGNRSGAKQNVTINAVPYSVYAIDGASTTAWDGRAIMDHLLMLIARKTGVLVKCLPPVEGIDPLLFFKSVLDVDGRDFVSVIHELITGAGFGWTIEPITTADGPTGGDVLGVNIVIFAMHGEDRNLGFGTIKGNPKVVAMPQMAHWLRARWRYINERCYDQVVTRGRRITATRTVAYSGASGFPVAIPAGLNRDWDAGAEARYLVAPPGAETGEQFENVYCRWAVSPSFNPCDAGKVGGVSDVTGVVDDAKLKFMRGRRGCVRTGLLRTVDYRQFAQDDMNQALQSIGEHIAGELIAKDPVLNEFVRVAPFRMLHEKAGAVVPGGPAAHDVLPDLISTMALTFAVELDYRIQARAGQTSDFGYTRVLITNANDARLEFIRNVVWSHKEDDAAAVYVINGVAANDFERMLRDALLRQSRMPNSQALADIRTLVIRPELRVGSLLRVGSTTSSSPIMSVSHDMVNMESRCQTERPYNA